MSRAHYIAFSTKNPAKHKCGDASFAEEIVVAGEKAVMLIVADGVSKAPKDWLASRSAVDFIVEEIQQSKKPIPETLKEAVETANSKICAGVENTFGMLTTLSAVMYHPANEKLYWCNLGDSRIFGLKNNEWHQLTTDDSTSMPYKENGKLKLQNGVPIMLSALTKAIGQDSRLKVDVHEMPVNEYSALALASDGFYDLSGFNRYATLLTNTADMQKEAAQLQNQIVSEISDDASIAVLRLPANHSIDLRKHLMEYKETATIPAGVLDILENELNQAILSKDNIYLEVLIQWMNTHKLYFDKPKMIELLELMIANKNPLVHEMTLLIRKI